MKSMTGYGESHKKIGSVNLSAVVRSVNGRFLDIKFHLPYEYLGLEKDLRALLPKTLKRGTVTVSIVKKKESSKSESKIVDAKRAAEVHKELKALAKVLKIKEEVTLDQILSFREGTANHTDEESEAKERKAIQQAFAEALKKYEEERSREGQSLLKNIEAMMSELVALTKKFESTRAEVVVQLKSKVEKRVAELNLKNFDDTRLSDEMAWLVDKSDISEEIERLKEHLSHMKKLLRSDEQPGKKLDFYCQELLREVNTLGSKTPSSEMTRLVVEAKSFVEQLKEQVQNIE